MCNIENTSKVLYEYYLNGGEVRKTECTVLSEKQYTGGKTIYQYTRNRLYGSKLISEEELGEVHNNHIYAFDDDIEKYREVFIEYVSANISELMRQVNRNKSILKKLEKACKKM